MLIENSILALYSCVVSSRELLKPWIMVFAFVFIIFLYFYLRFATVKMTQIDR